MVGYFFLKFPRRHISENLRVFLIKSLPGVTGTRRLAVFRKGVFARGSDVKDLIELHGFEDAADLLINPDQEETSSTGGNPLHRLEEKCEAPTVDPCHLLEIEEHRSFREFDGHVNHLTCPRIR